jgi:hypothetical protein
MTEGQRIRAEIGTENVKGLLLINGGGAVALLAFLPYVLGKFEYQSFARHILWALLIYQFGLIAAVIHNHLRPKCSLRFESGNVTGWAFMGRKFAEPGVCVASHGFMWLSAGAFVLAGLTVFLGGFRVF